MFPTPAEAERARLKRQATEQENTLTWLTELIQKNFNGCSAIIYINRIQPETATAIRAYANEAGWDVTITEPPEGCRLLFIPKTLPKGVSDA